MKKSVILFAALASALLPFRASAAEDSVNVHITIRQTTTVLDQDLTVTDINGDGRLTSRDAIITAHDQFFPGGAACGYADENFIWGLQGDYFYSNIGIGEEYDPLLHNPEDQRRDLKDGDRLCWEAGRMYEEIYYIYSPQLDELAADGKNIAQGTTLKVAVNHLIPNQPMDEPAPSVEIMLNGEKTGIFTDSHGWAEIPFDQAGEWTIDALTDALGLPCRMQRTVKVEPAATQLPKAAPAAEANARTEVQTDAQTSAAAAVVLEKTSTAPTSEANATTAQSQAAVRNHAVRTTGVQTDDSLPDIIMTLIGAGVAALAGALFIVFRKLH